MNKASLRKAYLEKRKFLTTAEAEDLSYKILLQLKTADFLSYVGSLHIFYPITGKKEINTLLIAEWIKNNYPDVTLILPKSDLKTNTLQHIIWTEKTTLAVNEWGITEPEYGEEVSPLDIDLVLMPLLVFDTKGNRIGYGKGFYDRFLTKCRPDTLKVGLSYFEPETEFDQVDPFDIPMDFCITPSKVWSFKK